jgi:ABC-type branched-subunit amino acid transport system substrate-binding protein
VNVFAPYVYDAVLIAFKAIDTLYAAGNIDFDGAALKDTLKTTVVEGITGTNTFDETQDRAPVYDIVNVKAGATAFSAAGT